jgi:hypothetical protein
MAGDWIKVETALSEKPETAHLETLTGEHRDAVVGKLVRFWSWANTHSADGNGLTVTDAWIDRHVECDGFASALRSVGWLAGEQGALSIPRFADHNGKSAKKRAQTARRVARHRDGNADDVTECNDGGATQSSLPLDSFSSEDQSAARAILAAYPREGREEVALPLVMAAVAESGSAEICRKVAKFAHAQRNTPTRFVPLAITWFRERRWLEERYAEENEPGDQTLTEWAGEVRADVGEVGGGDKVP